MEEIYDLWLHANYSEKDKYFVQLLEETRNGSCEALQCVKRILECTDAALGHWSEKCFSLLKPQDAAWLIDADSLVCDSIILAAMHKSYHNYTAYYVDEDTDEQVAIERSSLVDVPVFKRDTKFEQRVYSTFCDVYMSLPYIIYKRILYMLAYAEFETSRLAYSRLMAEEKRITGGGCITPYDEDICVDLGDIYCMGWEEFGITIDQTKAKAFYDRAGVDGYSLLDEE